MTNSNNPNNNQNLSHLVQQMSASEQHWQKSKQLEMQQEQKSEKLADKLWPMMADMYGHKFVSQYGEMPPETWVKCLMGISGQQIANGLNTCIVDCPVWPPSAPHFRNMCLGIATDEDGKEIAHRAGIYSSEPTEHMKARLLLRSDESRAKSSKAADSAIGEIMGMFGDQPKASKSIAIEPCKKCGHRFESILNICPQCQAERNPK